MEKKEEIYDFGELGKWSRSTLIGQWEWIRYDYIRESHLGVKMIEDRYGDRLNYYEEKINKIGKIRYFLPTVKKIQEDLEKYNYFKSQKDKLDDSYLKYRKTILEIENKLKEEKIFGEIRCGNINTKKKGKKNLNSTSSRQK